MYGGMEPNLGIEPRTCSLRESRSATELIRRGPGQNRTDVSPYYKYGAIPLGDKTESMTGIEPALNPWQGLVMPLHYIDMERVTGIEPA